MAVEGSVDMVPGSPWRPQAEGKRLVSEFGRIATAAMSAPSRITCVTRARERGPPPRFCVPGSPEGFPRPCPEASTMAPLSEPS